MALLPRAKALVIAIGTVAATGCATTTTATGFDAAAFYGANCMSCHGAAEGGTISDLPPRHNANGHTWHHGDCVIADTIINGAGPRPGLPADVATMPPFGDQLDEEEIAAVIDHMRAWWTVDQQQAQAATTQQACG